MVNEFLHRNTQMILYWAQIPSIGKRERKLWSCARWAAWSSNQFFFLPYNFYCNENTILKLWEIVREWLTTFICFISVKIPKNNFPKELSIKFLNLWIFPLSYLTSTHLTPCILNSPFLWNFVKIIRDKTRDL